jgi:hypothetical protein
VIELAFDINQIVNLPRPVTFALSLSLKDDLSLVTLQDVNEKSYNWIKFGSALKRTTIYMGAGLEVLPDFLWFGAGAHAMINGDAAADLTITVDRLSTDEPVVPYDQAIFMNLGIAINPMAGLIVKPTAKLMLGLSYKDDIAVEIEPFDAPIHLIIGDNVADINALTAIVSYWNPVTIRAGGAWQFDDFVVEFNIIREQWSGFKRSLTFETLKDLNPEIYSVPNFKDIFIYALGIERDWGEMTFFKRFTLTDIKIWAGYQYAPTPVPDQPGFSNYLGVDRHIISGGVGAEFRDPFGIVIHPIRVGFALQDQYLPRRNVNKVDSFNYAVSGNVITGVFSMQIRM